MSRGTAARVIVVALAIVDLAGCATNSTHQFAQPAENWQTRTGQLMYRNPNRRVIGDAFVRFSTAGDFELTFSKGPVTLLLLREDANFAEVKGPLAGRGWFGRIDHASQPLRGWIGLRDEIVGAQDRRVVRHAAGSETFVFRF
jgi:hypothetical protein